MRALLIACLIMLASCTPQKADEILDYGAIAAPIAQRVIEAMPIPPVDVEQATNNLTKAIAEMMQQRDAQGVSQDKWFDISEWMQMAGVVLAGLFGHDVYRNRTRKRDLEAKGQVT